MFYVLNSGNVLLFNLTNSTLTKFMYSFITSPILQLILSVLIILTVLFQHSEKGMDGAFGGSSAGGESIGTTKRGFELTLYRATLFFSILLSGSMIIQVMFA